MGLVLMKYIEIYKETLVKLAKFFKDRKKAVAIQPADSPVE